MPTATPTSWGTRTRPTSAPLWGVYRYTRDGSPDPSYGSDGVAPVGPILYGTVAPPTRVESIPAGMSLAADGRVYVATRLSEASAGVYRFTPDGMPDPTFGTGGRVAVTLDEPPPPTASGPCSRGQSPSGGVAALPDGKVVVLGQTRVGTTDLAAVVRLNPDGTPDPTFGRDGRFTFSPAPATGSGDTAVAVVAKEMAAVPGGGLAVLVDSLADEGPRWSPRTSAAAPASRCSRWTVRCWPSGTTTSRSRTPGCTSAGPRCQSRTSTGTAARPR